MQWIWLLIKVLIVVGIAYSVGYELYANRDQLNFIWKTWRHFNLVMLFEVLVSLILTVTAILAIVHYLPFLSWGWLNLFVEGGGNVYVAPMAEASKSSNIFLRLLPPVFFAVLFAAIPFMVRCEEEWFRSGYYEWADIAKQSVKYGMLHLLVGVPLAAGVALIIPGFLYGWKYRSVVCHAFGHRTLAAVRKLKERSQEYQPGCINIRITRGSEVDEKAILVCTAYHTLYNSLIVFLLFTISVIAV